MSVGELAMFGKAYDTVGSTNKNLILQTRGDLKIRWGNKFIDLIKNGKINVNIDLLKQVDNKDSINKDGIYLIQNEENQEVWLYIGGILVNLIGEISDNYVVVDFYDEGEIVINSDYYGGLELAYAITCHSSQGSQFKTVIVGFDNSSYILLSNEWLYTAITRAKKMCYLITQTKAFNMAVLHHKTVDRNTFLLELLKKEGK